MGRPRNSEKRARDQEAFLAAFAKTGIARTAAEEAGFKPVQHYRWLQDDPQYAARFAELETRTRELGLAKENRKEHSRGYKITEGPRAEKRKRDQEATLAALAKTGIVMDATAEAGIFPATFYIWYRNYPDFRERADRIMRDTAERRKELVAERTSAGIREVWDDPERRRAWGEYQRGAWTPEMREAAAERIRQRMADPEYKAAWLAASRESRKFAACGRPDYFDQIDTAEKAYWLGFIITDGCVRGFEQGSLRLQVKLARIDRGHLEILHRDLQANRPIRDEEQWSKPPGTKERKKRPVSILDVCSPQLVNALVGHGVFPRKTHIVQPWDGPADLMPHYWRGIMDGDGSIYVNGKSVQIELGGCKPLVDAFLAWAHGISGTTATSHLRPDTRDFWVTNMGGNQRPRILLAALYDDAPVALARKKALADLAVHGKLFSPTLF